MSELIHGGKYAIKFFTGLWVLADYDAGSESFSFVLFGKESFAELIEVESYVYLEGGEEIPDYDEPLTPSEEVMAGKILQSESEGDVK
jgi:hypothetical protein